jgi:hypothetical protein
VLHRLKPACAFLLLAAPACQQQATVELRNAVLEDCASECPLTDTGLDGSSGGTTGADTSPGTTWDETSNSTGQLSGFTSDGDAGGPGGGTGLTLTSWPGETGQTGGESGEGGATGDESGDESGGDTDGDDEFIDLWEPGEPEDDWMDDFPSLPPDGDDEGGSDESGDGTGGDTGGDTGDTGGDTGEPPPKPEPTCKAGEFTIYVYVKYKYGAEGKVSLAAGTLTPLGEETENGVLYKSYLACIPGDKIVGKDAPGVRISAAVAGTDPNDRVVGIRRGIDKNWIGQCLGNPAKSCWIDAKFNADGKNTLPIAVAVVYAEFARIETAPPPKPVEK